MVSLAREEVNTTGIPSLDRVLEGILPGDNIVWQIDTLNQYEALTRAFVDAAVRNERRLIYFRFASHAPLAAAGPGIEIHELHAEQGFEPFIEAIHDVIERAGRGAFYVFDCLSELAVDWYSDQMLGNFFMLTCPFLYKLETVTYFAIFRGHHSSRAIKPITETTQLFLNVYTRGDDFFIHPIKVWERFTPRMNMLHLWHGGQVTPVTSSAVIADVLRTEAWSGMGGVTQPGFWERTLLRAEDCLSRRQRLDGEGDNPEEIRCQLIRMCVSRDKRMLPLVLDYFTLEDVIDVRKRMIGSGLIGGKAVGMLLARSILRKRETRCGRILETHDSFYVGSDTFYTFLVRNGIWAMRRRLYSPGIRLEDADEARQMIMNGLFSDYIMQQFESMLDYFGQSPFIVRSSSLQEDNFGNSFAGKYDSIFCANQGSKRMRMQKLLDAVRTVYASTMSHEALSYREERGLLQQDEQMALLIQRVSGAMHGKRFFPQFAGVGFSFNPYVWSEYIDPKAGVLRLVFGLGTRAVDRSDDDYTRIVALNAPERRPDAEADQVGFYAQRRVDYLDLEANEFQSGLFDDLVDDIADLPLPLFVTALKPAMTTNTPHRILTFDQLLRRTTFVEDMREMMTTLEDCYRHPVDIEFAANFISPDEYRINLVQCRPLQTQGAEVISLPNVVIPDERKVLSASCSIIGQSRIQSVDRVVYVVPRVYGETPVSQRHEIARMIARLNKLEPAGREHVLMLIGPGRWGTSSPSLGVPVKFSEINHVNVVCELAAMRENFIPDLSLGTHFFNELVEMNMLYIAVPPRVVREALNEKLLLDAPNRLARMLPGTERWSDCVRVIEADDLCPAGRLTLHADCVEQRVNFFIDPAATDGFK